MCYRQTVSKLTPTKKVASIVVLNGLHASKFQSSCDIGSIYSRIIIIFTSHSCTRNELQLFRAKWGGGAAVCFTWKHLDTIFSCKIIHFLLWFSSGACSALSADSAMLFNATAVNDCTVLADSHLMAQGPLLYLCSG